jgi:hypothetical protein
LRRAATEAGGGCAGGRIAVAAGVAETVAAPVAAKGSGLVAAAVAEPMAARGSGQVVAAVMAPVADGAVVATGRGELVGNLTLLLTKSKDVHKKSIPNMGWDTSAS